MKNIIILACAALLAGAVFSTSAAAEIQIGVVGPMSGPYIAFGRQMRRGVEMAVKEINAAGGINGEKVKAVIGDDRCEADKGVEAAEKMVAKKALLVVGHFCSGASIGASRIYAREKIVQISPASSNPVFTEQRPGPGVFRVVSSDRTQAVFAGTYIASRFAGKKVALVEDDSNYGTSITAAVLSTLRAAGQPPVLTESYIAGDKDFSDLVSQLKAAGIEVVYVGGYHDDIGRLVREMRKQGVTAQLIAGDALVTDEFWRIAGRAGEGTLMTFSSDPRENAAAAGIVKKFRAKKINPEGYTLHSYVAVKLWADAAKAAGSAGFDGVIKEMNEMSLDTAIGPVRFDRNGDLVEPPLIWYVWHRGKYGPLKNALPISW